MKITIDGKKEIKRKRGEGGIWRRSSSCWLECDDGDPERRGGTSNCSRYSGCGNFPPPSSIFPSFLSFFLSLAFYFSLPPFPFHSFPLPISLSPPPLYRCFFCCVSATNTLTYIPSHSLALSHSPYIPAHVSCVCYLSVHRGIAGRGDECGCCGAH